MFSNWIVKTVQIFMFPFWYAYTRYVLKLKLSKTLNFNSNEKYIFTPNHPSKFDPFLVFYSIPFRNLRKLLPIRFMTAREYMKTQVGSFFMQLMGCYKITDNDSWVY